MKKNILHPCSGATVPITLATVCSGIGAPEEALRNIGINHKIVFGCEIDKYARQSYRAIHGDVPMYNDNDEVVIKTK